MADEYVKYFDFVGLGLDAALGQFLERFPLTGESQERGEGAGPLQSAVHGQ